ncbi:MAG: putative baseplate assembly protein [Prochloraceae cyanobacterium]|nr:putative baseplate assembly protein [Prochloraceae cyanobacterium]
MAREEDIKFDFLPTLPKENLDDRTFEDLVAECILRIPRYCPEWTDYNPSDPGITLVELFAWLTDQMLLRFNKVPRRNYITFLELLGIKLRSPGCARTRLTFYITQPDSYPYRILGGTEVGTERTETQEAIVFSTDEDLYITKPNLRYFLTAENAEDIPNYLREGIISQWTQQTNGEWSGNEQPLFNERPQPGNCFYLIFYPEEHLNGNVIAITFKGLAATPTGINPDRPPRSWQAWNGEKWESVLYREADDLTSGFSFNRIAESGGGAIQVADLILHLPERMPVTTFTGYEGHWLRCVYTEPENGQQSYTNTPRITGLNFAPKGGTVLASHSFFIRDELLGVSDGTPGQKFTLQSTPILDRFPSEHILVIPSGLPPQTWQEVADFAESEPESRHYTIDSLTGTVQFGPLIQEASRHVDRTIARASRDRLPVLGDYSVRRVNNAEGDTERQYGSIPPRGATIRMRAYRSGGGRLGNVETGTLKVLKSAVPYVNKVVNYEPAVGGSDGESLEQAMLRAPKMLRNRDRAVTKEDFETLTVAGGKGAIARALCLPTTEPGVINILVVPNGDKTGIDRGEGIAPDLLQLTAALSETTLAYLNERKLLGTQIRLTEPEYVGVTVETQIGLEPRYNNPQAKEMLRSQLEVALYRFLNPLTGGLEGNGWPFGRVLYVSDLIALFQKIAGVRYIGPVLLYQIRRRGNDWRRGTEPIQSIDPGSRGTICSWRDRRLRTGHLINFFD